MKSEDARREAARLKVEAAMPGAWRSAALPPYGALADGENLMPAWARESLRVRWCGHLGRYEAWHERRADVVARGNTWREALLRLEVLLGLESEALRNMAYEAWAGASRS